MGFSENGFDNRSKSMSKFRNIAKSMFSRQLLKPDLARCMCGMNMGGDGALKYSSIVLSNSTINIGGYPSGFCIKRNSKRQTLHSQVFIIVGSYISASLGPLAMVEHAGHRHPNKQLLPRKPPAFALTSPATHGAQQQHARQQ